MKHLLILLLALSTSILWASGDDEVHFTLDKNVKYSLDDNMAYAQKDFDDSSWSDETIGRLPTDWKGIGWFRYTINTPDELEDIPLAFMVRYAGAIEVYIDGELMVHDGKIGSNKETEVPVIKNELEDYVVIFKSANSETGLHKIAIRYSNYFRQDTGAYYGVLNRFHFQLVKMHHSQHFVEDKLVDWTVNQMFVVGAMLFLGLGLIISAVFGRGSKAALYYGLFSIALGGFVFADFERYFNPSPDKFLFHMRLYVLAGILAMVFFVRFIYGLLEQEASKIFYGLCAVAVAVFALSFGKPLDTKFLNILILLSAIEAIRVIITTKSKPDGLGIVWGGLAFMVLISLVSVAVVFGLIGSMWNPDLPIAVYSTMILAACFMIYEAKRIKAAS